MKEYSEAQIQKHQICIFTYHKVGSVLLSRVFREVSQEFGWQYRSLLGRQLKIPDEADVSLFSHSLIDLSQIASAFVGVHLIRDPRDIVVSGYLYHLRTSERWCTNTDFSSMSPILFPQVPYSQQHRSEEWKRNYLDSLSGRSYQENLLQRSQSDGLLFEMRNYASWTIESMRAWDFQRSNVLEVRFEDLMRHFDQTFFRIFEYLKFSPSQTKVAMKIAVEHDLGRKTDAEIAALDHVTSARTTRWDEYFDAAHHAEFRNLFPDVLQQLGYEE